jgi:hypothetical protein
MFFPVQTTIRQRLVNGRIGLETFGIVTSRSDKTLNLVL